MHAFLQKPLPEFNWGSSLSGKFFELGQIFVSKSKPRKKSEKKVNTFVHAQWYSPLWPQEQLLQNLFYHSKSFCSFHPKTELLGHLQVILLAFPHSVDTKWKQVGLWHIKLLRPSRQTYLKNSYTLFSRLPFNSTKHIQQNQKPCKRERQHSE